MQAKAVVIDKWSFIKVPQNFQRSVERGGCCGEHAHGLHKDKSRRSGASDGLTRWFSLTNLRCGGRLDSSCGVKATVFPAFGRYNDRKNPVVGAKKSLIAGTSDFESW